MRVLPYHDPASSKEGPGDPNYDQTGGRVSMLSNMMDFRVCRGEAGEHRSIDLHIRDDGAQR